MKAGLLHPGVVLNCSAFFATVGYTFHMITLVKVRMLFAKVVPALGKSLLSVPNPNKTQRVGFKV